MVSLKKFFMSCFVLLAASALAAVNTAHAATIVIDENNVRESPFREPLDTSSRNVSGSDAEKDGRGGTSALILELSADKGKATVEYTVGNSVQTLDDVVALSVVSFDIYTSVKLSAPLGGAAFKVKCGNTSKYAEFTDATGAQGDYPPSGEWTTLSFDLATAPFYPGGKTLPEWIAEGSWCSQDKFIPDRVQAFQVGIGSATSSPSPYNVYLDYFQFGTGADVYNFELANGTDVIDVPDAPTNLSAEAGDGFAVITFDQPEGSDNGAEITNYSWSGGGVTDRPLDPADKSTSITIPELTNGTTYSITLKAINSEGSSDPSDAVDVTPQASEILPAAPVITSVEPGNQQFKINFTQPSVTNESDIAEYLLRVEGVEDPIPTSQTESPLTVTGATNGATYTVSIAAKNVDDKEGPDSNQVTVTLPPDTDGDGVPDANDACPNDPTCTSLPVPTLPWPALLTLLSLLGWLGYRRLKLA